MSRASDATASSLDSLAVQVGERIVVREPIYTWTDRPGFSTKRTRTDAFHERFGTVVDADATRIRVHWDGGATRWLQLRTEGTSWHRAPGNVKPDPSPTEIWTGLPEHDREDLVYFASVAPHRKSMGVQGNRASSTRRLISNALIKSAGASGKCWILTELGERVIEVQVTLGRVLRQSAAPYCVLVSKPRKPVATEKSDPSSKIPG